MAKLEERAQICFGAVTSSYITGIVFCNVGFLKAPLENDVENIVHCCRRIYPFLCKAIQICQRLAVKVPSLIQQYLEKFFGTFQKIIKVCFIRPLVPGCAR